MPVHSTQPKSIDQLTADHVKAVLKKHDVNNDGNLSKEELKAAFQELGSRCPGLRVHFALHHADGNGDGKISEGHEMNEFVNYVVGLGYKIKIIQSNVGARM